MMIRGKCSLVMVAIGLVAFGISKRAEAVPIFPPPGYQYMTRVPMVAQNVVSINDPLLVQQGYRHAIVKADIAGTAFTIVSNNGVSSLNYYARFPYNTSSGAPDTSYFTFDLMDATGVFAGFLESFTWVSGGLTWYYLYQEVNGEDHYVYFSTNPDGSVNQSSVQQVKGKGHPDRCKIMADWGALQCPSAMDPIREIPTQVQSFLSEVGWFDNAMDWTWTELTRASNQVVTWLKDPTVEYVLTAVAIVAGTVVCCLVSATSICAVCAIGGAASVAAAAGAYGNSMNSDSGVPTITNGGDLRAAGILECSGTSCSVSCTSGRVSNGQWQTVCMYPAGGSSCPSGWGLLGPDCIYVVRT